MDYSINKQRRFVTNSCADMNPDGNTINFFPRKHSKTVSEKGAQSREVRRKIEMHMEQRLLEKELAKLGITDFG